MGAQETPHQSEISELENKIIQQVEYYFGNHNLRRDKFLKEQIKLDNGWVPLEVMVRFNRLKSLSEDTAIIAGALKKSPNHLLEVSEDETKIRRSLDKPLPEFSTEAKMELDNRTVYAKRFPPTTSLDDLLKFFRTYGNVENIFMKKKPNNKTFKGSVYVTFGTQEEAQNFLKLGSVKFNNSDLLRESKEAYVKRKEEEYKQRMSAKEMKRKKAQEEVKDPSEDLTELEKYMVRGCVLQLAGLSESNTREHIAEALQSEGEIAFLDYRRGEPVARVRFSEPVAESVLDKCSKTEEDGTKKITVNGVDAVATVVKGEAETEYWQKFRKAKSGLKNKRGKGRFNPKTGGRDRSKFGKRRRRHDDTREREREKEKSDETSEPPSKMAKVEKDDSESLCMEEKTEKDNGSD